MGGEAQVFPLAHYLAPTKTQREPQPSARASSHKCEFIVVVVVGGGGCYSLRCIQRQLPAPLPDRPVYLSVVRPLSYIRVCVSPFFAAVASLLLPFE